MLDFLDFCMSNKQKGHLAIMLVVVLYTASSVTISVRMTKIGGHLKC